MVHSAEKKSVAAGLVLIAIVLSVTAYFSGIAEGGADNYAHFNISRWAFQHPYLFLDHWGKPVFTILTAPFSQAGFWAVKMFNVIFGVTTAWFVYLLAIKLKLKPAWFAPVATVFIPIYFSMMPSGMTEILFSLVLVLSIYFFYNEKYILSALLISFIFLIRSEGLAFTLLFLVVLVIKKQYKAIPFLATGFLTFSLIGLLYYYHDFWWLITKRPYATGAESVYGSGAWYFYLQKSPDFMGNIFTFLLPAGTFAVVFLWIKDKFQINKQSFVHVILLLGCFWGYFFTHSYLWWEGVTSAGLLRVMAGVTPLAALIGLFFIHLFSRFKHSEKIVAIVFAAVSLVMINTAIGKYRHALETDLSAEILNRVTRWLKDSDSVKHKLVIHNPYFAFSTGVDPWDVEKLQNGFSDNNHPEENLPDSTIFIWDAHFSANEGRLPLEKMMSNKYFEVAAFFEPEIPFKISDRDYQIVVFRKISGTEHDNYALLQQIKQAEIQNGIYHIEEYDFEQPFPNEKMEERRIVSETDSANFIYDLGGAEFSPPFHISDSLVEKDSRNRVRVTLDVFMKETAQPNKLLLVFSAEKNDKSYHYVVADIAASVPELNTWIKTEFIFNVPQKLENGTVLKNYIWSIDKTNVLIDNFRVEISKMEDFKP